MTLAPLLNASPAVQIHTLAATAALVIGAAVLVLPKGTARHRMTGRIGAIALLITALTSFAIMRQGSLSIIHLLSVVTLVSLAVGYRAIRARRIASHAGWMRGAWFGLVGAAVFTLLPGRIMYQVVFGG